MISQSTRYRRFFFSRMGKLLSRIDKRKIIQKKVHIVVSYIYGLCISPKKDFAFFAPGPQDFHIDSRFVIHKKSKNGSPYYLYSGLKNFTWVIGVDSSLNIFVSIGNALSWTVLEYKIVKRSVSLGKVYSVLLTRRGRYLTLAIDGVDCLEIVVASDFYLHGNYLAHGVLRDSRTEKPHSDTWKVDFGAELAEISDINPHKTDISTSSINVLTVVYGERYAYMMNQFMFPSLFIGGNLSDLSHRKITHCIYCPACDLHLFDKHRDACASLNIELRFDSSLLSSLNPRADMHKAYAREIERSWKENSILVVAPPDHVFGHGLAKLITQMKPFDYVVCGHPRVDYNDGVTALEVLSIDNDYINGRSNRPLVDLALNSAPHSIVRHGLSTFAPYWHGTRKNDKFSIFFKEPPPLCLHAHPSMTAVLCGDVYYGHFEAIDHDLVDYAATRGWLKVVDDSDDFFWIELTDELTYYPTIVNDYWSDAAEKLFFQELIWRI
jgi:hypothetical protein